MKLPTAIATVTGVVAALAAAISGCNGNAAVIAAPRPLEAAEQQLVAARVDFGIELFQRLAADAGESANVLYSPQSVASALTLATTGAGGETRSAMAATLRIGALGGDDEVARAAGGLHALLSNPDPDVRIAEANALWAHTGENFAPLFASRAREHFHADATTLDLRGAAGAERINAWVSANTEGMIKEIVDAGDLAQARAVLTNAVYFHGMWTTQFDRARTRDGEFSRPDGSTRTVPMMSHPEPIEVGYVEKPGFSAVALPYGKTGRVRMYLFLPSEASSIPSFVEGLNSTLWSQWMGEFALRDVDVRIPRFRAEFEAELKPPLTEMGMGIAFSPAADLGPMGISGAFIDQVKHKAVIDVNEEGTEAAAATAIIGVTSVPDTLEFHVNRPFLFAIRDDHSGAVLFVGVIRDPGN